MKISSCKIRGIPMYGNDVITNMHPYIHMNIDMPKLVTYSLFLSHITIMILNV